MLTILNTNVNMCQARHVKGHDFIGLYVGYVKNMYSIAGTYQKYFNNRMSGKVMGLYDWSSVSKTDYNSVSVYPQFEYCLLTNNVNLFLNIKPGIFSGMEFFRKPTDLQNMLQFLWHFLNKIF